jgi:hypothetical protein
MALKMDFGILYYEDRRPPYRKLVTAGGRKRRPSTIFGRFLGLLEDRCECGTRCARVGSSGDSLCDNVLLCLIAVLSRNTLVPSATRSMERGR